MTQEPFRCGAIALIGRPNVGKSTLLNALLGQKLSITSRKPQTTRHALRGVLTTRSAQFIFIDTPGFQTRYRSGLNRAMSRFLRGALEEVDVAALLVEAGRFCDEDRALLELVPARAHRLLVVNKMETVSPEHLLAFLKDASRQAEFDAIVPVSARRRRGLGELLHVLQSRLPEQQAIHAEDEITDRSERFLAAEFLREKLFRLLGEELPYSAGVQIDKFEERRGVRHIHASIVVEKEGHKAIVIGLGGGKLKAIATAARRDMEKLFGSRVYLKAWVKVRRDWTQDEGALKGMGYG